MRVNKRSTKEHLGQHPQKTNQKNTNKKKKKKKKGKQPNTNLKNRFVQMDKKVQKGGNVICGKETERGLKGANGSKKNGKAERGVYCGDTWKTFFNIKKQKEQKCNVSTLMRGKERAGGKRGGQKERKKWS